MTRERIPLVLAVLFLVAGFLLLASLAVGQTRQLSPGPVLLTSPPAAQP